MGEIDQAQDAEDEGEADGAEGEIPGADQPVHRRLAGGDGADGQRQQHHDDQQADRQEDDGRQLAPSPERNGGASPPRRLSFSDRLISSRQWASICFRTTSLPC